MAKFSEIVKIDDRGRIVIPGSTRKIMKLAPGTKLLMNVDEERNQIILTPFLGVDVKPIGIRIVMKDKKGALAHVATAISELGINLLLGEAHIVSKGKQAEWSIIADLSTVENIALEEIKDKIINSGGADEVEFSNI
ncbi:MAG: ACT domain-containing protein [Promethearchaeota archaeon]